MKGESIFLIVIKIGLIPEVLNYPSFSEHP